MSAARAPRDWGITSDRARRPAPACIITRFTLIATDLEPNALPAGLTRAELFAKLNGHTKGAAGLVGLFGRAKE